MVMVVVVIVTVVTTAAVAFLVIVMVFVLVVMVAAAVVAFLVVVLMVVAVAAAAVVAFLVVVLMVVTVAAAAVVSFLMVVLMVVTVAAAAVVAFLVMVLMVVTVAAAAVVAFLMMVLVLMVVVTAAAVTLFVVMVMVVLFLQLCKLRSQGCLTFHGLQQLLTGQFAPGSGDNGGMLIVLPEHGNCHIQLLLRDRIGAGEDNGGSSFHLVIVELAKVLHIHLNFAGIHYCNRVAQKHILGSDLLHSGDHIAELAHAGGLDDDAVGVVLRDDLGQRPAKVAHQGAADTAGVHLGDVDARLLQEAAVDTDLAEFVFDQHQLLTCISLLDHFFDEGGLART